MNYIELSGVASVLVLAASLMLAARLLARSSPLTEGTESVLRYTAYVLFAIGLLGVCLISFGAWAIIAWPIVIGVWIRSAMHYRAMQKRNLLSALAVAVDQRMPLAPMARAFANEQERGFAFEAGELATKLEHGATVEEALGNSRRALPPESALAAAVGLESGDLPAALRATTYAGVFDRTSLNPALSRLLYLFAVVMITLSILTFMEIKILPSWVKILDDFGLEGVPPEVMHSPWAGGPLRHWLVNLVAIPGPPGVAAGVVAGAFVTATIALAALGFFALGVYCWLQWRGWVQPRLPVWRRIVTWVDMGPVLRLLALAARRSRPLTGTLCAIARYHPKGSLRTRAWQVVRSLDNGMPWQDSLRASGLINSADAAMLAAAERSGNLPWALSEMAAGYERKANYRMHALTQVLIPILLLPLGIGVAAVAITYFVALAALIQHIV